MPDLVTHWPTGRWDLAYTGAMLCTDSCPLQVFADTGNLHTQVRGRRVCFSSSHPIRLFSRQQLAIWAAYAAAFWLLKSRRVSRKRTSWCTCRKRERRRQQPGSC